MSAQTPQTDAEAVRFARLMIEWHKPRDEQVTELIPADFARTLEADRNHYKALCEELRGALKQIRHELGRHYGPGPHCTCGQTGMGNICIAALKD